MHWGAPVRRLGGTLSLPPFESSLSQDPNFEDFQARRIEPSCKGTTA